MLLAVVWQDGIMYSWQIQGRYLTEGVKECEDQKQRGDHANSEFMMDEIGGRVTACEGRKGAKTGGGSMEAAPDS